MQNVERQITIKNPEKILLDTIIRDQSKQPEARIRAEWLDYKNKHVIKSIDIAPYEHRKSSKEKEELSSIIAGANRITLKQPSPIPPITIKGLTPSELRRILEVQKGNPKMLITLLVKATNDTSYTVLDDKKAEQAFDSLKTFKTNEPLESRFIIHKSQEI